MELSYAELKDLLTMAAEAGASNALVAVGQLKPFISKSEADKLYGRGTVDRWIREGLIKQVKDGTNSSKIRIDRLKIDLVSKASNRASWYEHLNDDNVFDPKIIK